MGWFNHQLATFFCGELGFCLRWCSKFSGSAPLKFNSSPLKKGGWKTILFFGELVTFQGRTVKLQGINFLLGKRICVCTSWICWICFDSVIFVRIRSHGIHHQFSPPFGRRCFYFFHPPQANLRWRSGVLLIRYPQLTAKSPLEIWMLQRHSSNRGQFRPIFPRRLLLISGSDVARLLICGCRGFYLGGLVSLDGIF